MNNDSEPLADWERELLFPEHEEGYGEVTFTRTDGQVLTIDNLRVDSIGPAAENFGVIGAETIHGEVIHLPFIQSWTIHYRL